MDSTRKYPGISWEKFGSDDYQIVIAFVLSRWESSVAKQMSIHRFEPHVQFSSCWKNVATHLGEHVHPVHPRLRHWRHLCLLQLYSVHFLHKSLINCNALIEKQERVVLRKLTLLQGVRQKHLLLVFVIWLGLKCGNCARRLTHTWQRTKWFWTFGRRWNFAAFEKLQNSIAKNRTQLNQVWAVVM